MRTYDSSRFGWGRGSLVSPGSLRTPIKPNPHVGGGDRMITKENWNITLAWMWNSSAAENGEVRRSMRQSGKKRFDKYI